ncbi:MAG: outer membrane lipoprotein carrier protein LolA [Desulfobulbaceae bacterium]|nr:outer membrane lipoprotein carrier protein LolA [Desulfobulbaceae bacterium]
MKIFTNTLFLTLALLFVGSPATANPLTPLAVAEKLQQTYNKTTTLTADFRQLSSMRMQRRQRQGSGTLTLHKPGRIRWNYLQPDRQVLISNGDTVKMYFAKTSQMMVMPSDRYLNSDVTYAFFVGNGDICRDFEIHAPDAAPFLSDGQYCIKLIPKETHPQLSYLHLWVSNSTWLVERIQLVDQLSSITDLFFTNIITNKPVADGTFDFTPPPNTEIIEQ